MIRRRWRRWVVVVVMIVVVIWLRRGLRGGLLDGLNDSGMAAGERQHSRGSQKKGGERLGSSHLSFSWIDCKRWVVKAGLLVRCEKSSRCAQKEANLAHIESSLRKGCWGDLKVSIMGHASLANGRKRGLYSAAWVTKRCGPSRKNVTPHSLRQRLTTAGPERGDDYGRRKIDPHRCGAKRASDIGTREGNNDEDANNCHHFHGAGD